VWTATDKARANSTTQAFQCIERLHDTSVAGTRRPQKREKSAGGGVEGEPRGEQRLASAAMERQTELRDHGHVEVDFLPISRINLKT
jgi:hypothetical protein